MQLLKYIMLIGITVLLMLLFSCNKEKYECKYSKTDYHYTENLDIEYQYDAGLITYERYVFLKGEYKATTTKNVLHFQTKQEIADEMQTHNYVNQRYAETCNCY